MAGISVSGIGSGLDINSLVSQLVAAEGQPAGNRLNRREARFQAELSAIGTFKGALSELQSAVSGLTGTTKFLGMKATVGDESLLTASATSIAQAGSYGIEIQQLARAQRLASAAAFANVTDTLGSGTLTIRLGSYDSDGTTFLANPEQTAGTVTIDASNNTLEGVRDAINEADIGVRANLVNDGGGYRLVLGPTATGSANALEITVGDDDGNDADAAGLSQLAYGAATKNLVQTLAAEDAVLVVDGLTVTHSSNTLSDVLQGVTLDLQAAKPGTTTEVTVGRDTAAASGAVQAFVAAFNKLVEATGTLTSYNPETRERGALLGDAGVRSVSGQLRRMLGETLRGGAGRFDSLSDVGIRFQRDGSLKLDGAKFQSALESDPEAVASLFAGAQEESGPQTPGPAPQGFADRLDGYLSDLLKTGGPLDARTTSLNQRIDRIGDQREALGRRLESLEARYLAQFTAMDKLISQLTATGNYLAQQLAGLSGNGNGNGNG